MVADWRGSSGPRKMGGSEPPGTILMDDPIFATAVMHSIILLCQAAWRSRKKPIGPLADLEVPPQHMTAKVAAMAGCQL
jgi:hypothetical protein